MQFGQQGGWLGIWVQSPERQLSEPGSPSITRGQKHIRGHLLVRYFSKSPRFETCERNKLPELAREILGGR